MALNSDESGVDENNADEKETSAQDSQDIARKN